MSAVRTWRGGQHGAQLGPGGPCPRASACMPSACYNLRVPTLLGVCRGPRLAATQSCLPKPQDQGHPQKSHPQSSPESQQGLAPAPFLQHSGILTGKQFCQWHYRPPSLPVQPLAQADSILPPPPPQLSSTVLMPPRASLSSEPSPLSSEMSPHNEITAAFER